MPPASLTLALTPLVAIAAAAAAHVLVARMLPRLAKVHGIVLALAAGLAVVAAGVAALAGAGGAGRWGTAATWALAYLALAYFYVFGFFNVGESARRIRLLVELDAAGPRGMTREELVASYSARMIVTARFERLVAGGQARERDGRYVVGRPLMLRGAKALCALKVLFLGRPTEFGPDRSLTRAPEGRRAAHS